MHFVSDELTTLSPAFAALLQPHPFGFFPPVAELVSGVCRNEAARLLSWIPPHLLALGLAIAQCTCACGLIVTLLLGPFFENFAVLSCRAVSSWSKADASHEGSCCTSQIWGHSLPEVGGGV